MTYTIVPGDESNWHRIGEIYDADGYDRAAASIRERTASELDEFRAGGRILWLAEAGGAIIATIGLAFRGRDAGLADGVTSANINRLHVVQAQRRNGVASALIATAEEEARRRGFTAVTIEVRRRQRAGDRVVREAGLHADRPRHRAAEPRDAQSALSQRAPAPRRITSGRCSSW